ncbi:MAG: GNAT family N-acetyltransferase [Actinomycetota bacterium]
MRPARAAERAAAGELTAAAYVADGLLGPTDPYLAELTDAAGRAEAPHTELLVAVTGPEVGPAVLGTVTFVRPGSPYAEISRPGEAEFRMLAVDPDARGRGLGELLVRACVERATRAGDRWLVLSTHPRMAAAHRLYRRLGFTRLPERDWTPVPGVDLLAYRLALGPGASGACGASGASGASGG